MAEDYQMRMIAEREELNGRIIRLVMFLSSDRFNTVQADEQKRMHKQLMIMGQYSSILLERIEALTDFGENINA